MNELFTEPNAWLGGYYELALELGPRSDERVLAALNAVWSDPALAGVYLRRDLELHEQQAHSITAELLEVTHLQGLARLPTGATIVCGTCLIRYDQGTDWLDFYLPLGALARAYPVGGYPFEPDAAASRVWRNALDAWLAAMGRRVYEHVAYRLGLIGFEVSAEISASEIMTTGIPADRYPGLLWPTAEGLQYYSSTI